MVQRTESTSYSSQQHRKLSSARQTLGAPNVGEYGHNVRAWARRLREGKTEFLTLGFATPIFANGVTIWESWGNGFVTDVEVRNKTTGGYMSVFSGQDPSQPGSVVDFQVSFPQTTFRVDAVRVTVDAHHASVREQIDAVQLHGVADPPGLVSSLRSGFDAPDKQEKETVSTTRGSGLGSSSQDQTQSGSTSSQLKGTPFLSSAARPSRVEDVRLANIDQTDLDQLLGDGRTLEQLLEQIDIPWTN